MRTYKGAIKPLHGNENILLSKAAAAGSELQASLIKIRLTDRLSSVSKHSRGAMNYTGSLYTLNKITRDR